MSQTQQNVAIQPTSNAELSTNNQTASERFTQKVIREFAGTGGTIALTDFQKRLVQNYFISLDQSLKASEIKRLNKSEEYRDPLPITWQNINMEQLAVNVVASARVGFDPVLPNHVSMIPYKNNATQKYDIGFIPGYRGKEIMAVKYGLEVPSETIIELVFANDRFRPIKRDINNKVESYIFEVSENPFDRGELVGGFYYHVYEDGSKSKLVFWPKSEIDKRKPTYASVEFWGGEKDKWVKDPATGKNKKAGTEHIEGWYLEMAWKTLCRAAYGSITIDSQKIDDNYINLSASEYESESRKPLAIEDSLQNKIAENSQMEQIVITESTVIDTKPLHSAQPQPQTIPDPKPEQKPEPKEYVQPQEELFKQQEEKKELPKSPKF